MSVLLLKRAVSVIEDLLDLHARTVESEWCGPGQHYNFADPEAKAALNLIQDIHKGGMRMDIVFESNDYRFVAVIREDDKKQTWFTLDATCKDTGLTSTVNTVNEVMSYFDANPNKRRFCESDWRLKKREVIKVQNRLAELMVTDDLSWLDAALHADRSAGEWERR